MACRIPDADGDSIRQNDHYIVVTSSASCRKVYGCACWTASQFGKLPIKRFFVITTRAIAVRDSQERRLIWTVETVAATSSVAVLHASHMLAIKAEVCAWWQYTADMLNQIDGAVYCMVDANARIGSIVKDQNGDCGAEREKPHGGIFREFFL